MLSLFLSIVRIITIITFLGFCHSFGCKLSFLNNNNYHFLTSVPSNMYIRLAMWPIRIYNMHEHFGTDLLIDVRVADVNIIYKYARVHNLIRQLRFAVSAGVLRRC